MSDVANDAQVAVLIADYAAIDAAGKVNAIGVGFQFAGLNVETGTTSPQTVIVLIDVPPKHYSEEFAVSLSLVDQVGDVVNVPGPTGEATPLRIAQVHTANVPQVPNAYIPKDLLPSRIQIVVNFAGGLPLAAGQLYAWQVDIDGSAEPHWRAVFFVPGPPPRPVIG